MEAELWARVDADPHARGAFHADIHLRLLKCVGDKIQMDDPTILTDDVVAHLASVAHKSIFPMFREEVDAEVRKMRHRVVQRAYYNISKALHIFVHRLSELSELAGPGDWVAWMDTL